MRGIIPTNDVTKRRLATNPITNESLLCNKACENLVSKEWETITNIALLVLDKEGDEGCIVVLQLGDARSLDCYSSLCVDVDLW